MALSVMCEPRARYYVFPNGDMTFRTFWLPYFHLFKLQHQELSNCFHTYDKSSISLT